MVSRGFFAAAILLSLGRLPAATLKVHVKDAFNAAPVDATVIAVGRAPTVVSARTDPTGRATFELPSLEVISIAVRSNTHGMKCVAPDQTNLGDVTVNVEPSVRVYGVVRGSAGTPLQSATVKVVYAGQDDCRVRFDHGMGGERTDERGEFVLRGVEVGRELTIVFQHDRHRDHEVKKSEVLAGLGYPAGRKKELNVTLTPR